jgi:ribose-phosphate pyrophosphokinase
MRGNEIAIFALNASREFGEKICSHLGRALDEHEEREFEDGEHKTRSLVNVRNRDVFVIQSLYGDDKQSVNDKLCRLLFFIGALRDASAQTVTAILPYLCYARKDKKSKSRDPVSTRYVANMLESIGADRVVTMDVHNIAAFQNSFRIRTDHLEARKIFVEYFVSMIGTDEVAVVSPDVGGVKRAEDFRQALSKKLSREVSSAFMEKYRSADVVSGEKLIGDVAGKTAIIIDDLISSGTTLARAAAACRTQGAQKIFAAATHGVFNRKANEVFSSDAIEKLVITNTIPPFRIESEKVKRKLVELDATELFAEAIRRIHSGDSIEDLLAT